MAGPRESGRTARRKALDQPGHAGKVAQVSTEADLKRQLAALRRAGVSLPECGRRLGVSYQTAQRWWSDLLQQLDEETRQEVKFYRAVESDRLNALLVRAWTAAHPAGGGFNKDAVMTCLRLIEAKCRLWGLFAPEILALTQVNIEDGEAAEAAMDAMVKFERLFSTVEKALPAPVLEGELGAPTAPTVDDLETETLVPSHEEAEPTRVSRPVPDRIGKFDGAEERLKALAGAEVGNRTDADDAERDLFRPNWEHV